MMSTYLLDTHLILWLFFTPERVPSSIIGRLKSRETEVYVSAASFWEIAIKFKLGKLNMQSLVPLDVLDECLTNGFKLLPIDCTIAASSSSLKANYHKDPFDRLLIWQALINNMILITEDEKNRLYESEGLKTLWA